MKTFRKCTAAVMSGILFVCLLTGNAFALNSMDEEKQQDKKEIVLQTANMTEEKTDEGFVIAFDLLQEVKDSENSSRSIGWIVTGYAKFRLRLYVGNSYGMADYQIDLTNGDYISGVTGTFVIEKDILGSINPNYAKVHVNDSYDQAYYIRASGSEDFDFSNDVSYSQKIIFKWSNFKVRGVMDDYIIIDGNKQGVVEDFTV